MAEAAPAGIYDPERLRMVLETIATKAATLRDLLNGAMMMGEESRAMLVETAFSQAQFIGLLADTTVGGIVTGDALDWACGPNFRGAPGQEASHA